MQQPIGSWDDVGYQKLLGEIRPESLSALGTYTDRSPVYPITHHPPVLVAPLILAAIEWHAKVVRQPYGSFNDCLAVLAGPRGNVEFLKPIGKKSVLARCGLDTLEWSGNVSGYKLEYAAPAFLR